MPANANVDVGFDLNEDNHHDNNNGGRVSKPSSCCYSQEGMGSDGSMRTALADNDTALGGGAGKDPHIVWKGKRRRTTMRMKTLLQLPRSQMSSRRI